jgi:hypothetical protein
MLQVLDGRGVTPTEAHTIEYIINSYQITQDAVVSCTCCCLCRAVLPLGLFRPDLSCRRSLRFSIGAQEFLNNQLKDLKYA